MVWEGLRTEMPKYRRKKRARGSAPRRFDPVVLTVWIIALLVASGLLVASYLGTPPPTIQVPPRPWQGGR